MGYARICVRIHTYIHTPERDLNCKLSVYRTSEEETKRYEETNNVIWVTKAQRLHNNRGRKVYGPETGQYKTKDRQPLPTTWRNVLTLVQSIRVFALSGPHCLYSTGCSFNKFWISLFTLDMFQASFSVPLLGSPVIGPVLVLISAPHLQRLLLETWQVYNHAHFAAR